MIQKIPISLIIASIILATLLHKRKAVNRKSDIDKFTDAIAGSSLYIPPYSHIFLENKTGKSELFVWSRFALAPAYISFKLKSDTVLSIYNKGEHPDQNRKVLWQHTDSNYLYTLSYKQ